MSENFFNNLVRRKELFPYDYGTMVDYEHSQEVFLLRIEEFCCCFCSFILITADKFLSSVEQEIFFGEDKQKTERHPRDSIF